MIKKIIGGLLLIIGIFYTLLPHTIHMSSGLGFGLPHTTHLLIGTVLLIAGVILLVLGKKVDYKRQKTEKKLVS